MLWTQTLIPTMKETPEGAEIPSHVLMLRAGLVSQVMAGAYIYLPLGLRSLRKAERIVREEMDAAGAVELHMPALTPLSLWEQTGRAQAFGDVLIQFSVRRQNRKVQMALGPTHEEVITDLISRLSPAIGRCRWCCTRFRPSSATRSGRDSACCAPANFS